MNRLVFIFCEEIMASFIKYCLIINGPEISLKILGNL